MGEVIKPGLSAKIFSSIKPGYTDVCVGNITRNQCSLAVYIIITIIQHGDMTCIHLAEKDLLDGESTSVTLFPSANTA